MARRRRLLRELQESADRAAGMPPGAGDGGSGEPLPPGQEPKPWERQPGEDTGTFALARVYFNLGPDRTLKALSQETSHDKTLLERWSTRDRWAERAQAYDDWRFDVAQEERAQRRDRRVQLWESRQDDLRERQWRLAEALFAVADRGLEEHVREGQKEYPIGELLAILGRASEMARFAAGFTGATKAPGKQARGPGAAPPPDASGENQT